MSQQDRCLYEEVALGFCFPWQKGSILVDSTTDKFSDH